METKINIAELLKDCPKGTKLYSPLCGECYFERLNQGTIICKKRNTQTITFTSDGYYMLPVFDGAEPMLFPSKENRDWNKFHRPFTDGDIIYVCDEYSDATFTYVAILKQIEKGGKIISHCFYNYEDDIFSTNDYLYDCYNIRFATEIEKQKLFDAIKANGYKWNDETKTLEKLIEPKFKVGDRVKDKNNFTYTVLSIEGWGYILDDLHRTGVAFGDQDNFELVPNKFDITTLIPFESRVLVRDINDEEWCPAIWGVYGYGKKYPHIVVSGNKFIQCIPYEGNEHLLGTTNDCDEYYRTWE